MNFKVFGFARNRNNPNTLVNASRVLGAPHKHRGDAIVVEHDVFNKALAKAVDEGNVNQFIRATFSKNTEFESSTLLVESFEDFFSNFRLYCVSDDFFSIFYAICFNINLLSDEIASQILSLACEAYYSNSFDQKLNSLNMLDELIENLPLPLVEDAVLDNISSILDDKTLLLSNFKYFTYFESWHKMIVTNLRKVLQVVSGYEAGFEEFIELFPELTSQVYEYIFEKVLVDDECIWNIVDDDDFDFIDSILKPMADYEKYQGYYFEIIREKVPEIFEYLSSHGKYLEMYYACDFLVEEFGFSKEEVDELFKRRLYESVEKVCKISTDLEALSRLISIPEGYDYLMENIAYLLSEYGIILYALLIKLLGPIPAITSKEFCCREYIER